MFWVGCRGFSGLYAAVLPDPCFPLRLFHRYFIAKNQTSRLSSSFVLMGTMRVRSVAPYLVGSHHRYHHRYMDSSQTRIHPPWFWYSHVGWFLK